MREPLLLQAVTTLPDKCRVCGLEQKASTQYSVRCRISEILVLVEILSVKPCLREPLLLQAETTLLEMPFL